MVLLMYQASVGEAKQAGMMVLMVLMEERTSPLYRAVGQTCWQPLREFVLTV